MAVRRMFSMNIINSDAFLDMSASAQNLYFHLNMRADDDGFVNSPRTVMRIVGAEEADLALLAERGYLLCFDNGVVAIAHWRAHNQLRRDRYTPTQYQELFSALTLKPNGEYALCAGPENPPPDLATKWQPDGNPGKVRIV